MYIFTRRGVTFPQIRDYFANIYNLCEGKLIKKAHDQFDIKAIEAIIKRAEKAMGETEVIEDCARKFQEFGAKLQGLYGNEVRLEAVSIFEENYPSLIREIETPPLVLFIAGKKFSRDSENFSIVGTRNPSPYALRECEKIAAALVEKGLTIVSGMAAGIDRCAHETALKNGGRTYAVLGTGIDICYPPTNDDVYYKIIENGALVSEYLPGAHGEPNNFAARNRIIAGFSPGTLVIAAGDRSGALITARNAFENGRKVFALCGDVTRTDFEGSHELIKKSMAKLAVNDADILSEMGFFKERSEDLPTIKKVRGSKKNAAREVVFSKLNELEKIVFSALVKLEGVAEGGQPSIDEVLEFINRNAEDIKKFSGPNEIFSTLAELEIKGIVNTFFGKRYETVK
ncbi:MAG TPA: DNA-processing protein DprA [Candidatus Wallbacteria bacterium]|nr:DNA-processing protein DprA [Candidatus Wallbacteria bacterium]